MSHGVIVVGVVVVFSIHFYLSSASCVMRLNSPILLICYGGVSGKDPVPSPDLASNSAERLRSGNNINTTHFSANRVYFNSNFKFDVDSLSPTAFGPMSSNRAEIFQCDLSIAFARDHSASAAIKWPSFSFSSFGVTTSQPTSHETPKSEPYESPHRSKSSNFGMSNSIITFNKTDPTYHFNPNASAVSFSALGVSKRISITGVIYPTFEAQLSASTGSKRFTRMAVGLTTSLPASTVIHTRSSRPDILVNRETQLAEAISLHSVACFLIQPKDLMFDTENFTECGYKTASKSDPIGTLTLTALHILRADTLSYGAEFKTTSIYSGTSLSESLTKYSSPAMSYHAVSNSGVSSFSPTYCAYSTANNDFEVASGTISPKSQKYDYNQCMKPLGSISTDISGKISKCEFSSRTPLDLLSLQEMHSAHEINFLGPKPTNRGLQIQTRGIQCIADSVTFHSNPGPGSAATESFQIHFSTCQTIFNSIYSQTPDISKSVQSRMMISTLQASFIDFARSEFWSDMFPTTQSENDHPNTNIPLAGSPGYTMAISFRTRSVESLNSAPTVRCISETTVYTTIYIGGSSSILTLSVPVPCGSVIRSNLSPTNRANLSFYLTQGSISLPSGGTTNIGTIISELDKLTKAPKAPDHDVHKKIPSATVYSAIKSHSDTYLRSPFLTTGIFQVLSTPISGACLSQDYINNSTYPRIQRCSAYNSEQITHSLDRERSLIDTALSSIVPGCKTPTRHPFLQLSVYTDNPSLTSTTPEQSLLDRELAEYPARTYGNGKQTWSEDATAAEHISSPMKSVWNAPTQLTRHKLLPKNTVLLCSLNLLASHNTTTVGISLKTKSSPENRATVDSPSTGGSGPAPPQSYTTGISARSPQITLFTPSTYTSHKSMICKESMAKFPESDKCITAIVIITDSAGAWTARKTTTNITTPYGSCVVSEKSYTSDIVPSRMIPALAHSIVTAQAPAPAPTSGEHRKLVASSKVSGIIGLGQKINSLSRTENVSKVSSVLPSAVTSSMQAIPAVTNNAKQINVPIYTMKLVGVLFLGFL